MGNTHWVWRVWRGAMSVRASGLMLTYVHPLPGNATAFKDFNEPIFISPLFLAPGIRGTIIECITVQKALKTDAGGN